jgi:SAM-dependent methyltransferase
MQKLYRVSALPFSIADFQALPIVCGALGAMVPLSDGSLTVAGWLLLPDRPLNQIDVYLDGISVLRSVGLTECQDVAISYKWIPHALTSGFNFVLPLSRKQSAGTSVLEFIAFDGGTPAGRFSHLVRADLDRFPSPPKDYAFRVNRNRDLHYFKVGGLRTFGHFMRAALQHGRLSGMKRILDWGCGCGRVTAHLMGIEDGPEVFGCDIDPLAIEWCNRHLKEGAFSVIKPLPPTPYPDAHFDLIVSYSVFTHLTRDVQEAWLQEMQRLLSPRGIFLATVHGKFPLSVAKGVPNAEFPPSGIEDLIQDDALEGIAPENYYRSTYQAQEYTVREFGKYFKVLEYIERGVDNFQDLIVLAHSGFESKTENEFETISRPRGELERKLAVLERKAERLSAELETATRARGELERKLADFQSETERLNAELETATRARGELERKLADFQSETERLSAELETATRARGELERDLVAILSSRTWRLTASLRAVVSSSRRWWRS